jgi:hypothetical protein
MKNKSLLIVACVCAFVLNAHAAVLTVSNNTFSPGHFYNLQTAIDSANAGDSIYVEPSPVSYGNITIINKVNLFGGGGVPNTYQLNNPTYLNTVTFATQSFPASTSDGSQIEGFNITGGLTVNSGINGITIQRNYFTTSLTVTSVDTNIVIVNNIFAGQQVYITSNYNNDNTVLIANNMFVNSDGNGGSQGVFENSGYEQQGVQVLNNIFQSYNQNASNSGMFFRSLNYATVKNNIFFCVGGSGAFVSGCSNCNMQNNITYTEGYTTQTLPDAGNSGSGNFNNVGATPFAAGGPAAYTQINAALLYNYNWTVIGTYATGGTDGTPVGIYGGAYPMPNYETVTRLPQVRQVNITNTSVAPNGTLNVNIIGTTRN